MAVVGCCLLLLVLVCCVSSVDVGYRLLLLKVVGCRWLLLTVVGVGLLCVRCCSLFTVSCLLIDVVLLLCGVVRCLLLELVVRCGCVLFVCVFGVACSFV